MTLTHGVDSLRKIAREHKIPVDGFRLNAAPRDKLITAIVNSKKFVKVIADMNDVLGQKSDEIRKMEDQKIEKLLKDGEIDIAAVFITLISSNVKYHWVLAARLFITLEEKGQLKDYVQKYKEFKDQNKLKLQPDQFLANLQQQLKEEKSVNKILTANLAKTKKAIEKQKKLVEKDKIKLHEETNKWKTDYLTAQQQIKDLEKEIVKILKQKSILEGKIIEISTKNNELEQENAVITNQLKLTRIEIENLKNQIFTTNARQPVTEISSEVIEVNHYQTKYALVGGKNLQKLSSAYPNIIHVRESEVNTVDFNEYEEILLPTFACSGNASLKLQRVTNKNIIKFNDMYELKKYIEGSGVI